MTGGGVILAKARISLPFGAGEKRSEIPAFAGMTGGTASEMRIRK
jgi:hypothetical protein